jgi:hypothetical protein
MREGRKMARKTHDPIAERFANLAIRIWKGDRTVVEDIRRIMPDREIEEAEYGIVGKGPNGMSVGIRYGLEPPLVLVQLGFLYAGPVWPSISFLLEAFKLTRKMWREEAKVRQSKVNFDDESHGGEKA